MVGGKPGLGVARHSGNRAARLRAGRALPPCHAPASRRSVPFMVFDRIPTARFWYRWYNPAA
jgi:hypothetical protein